MWLSISWERDTIERISIYVIFEVFTAMKMEAARSSETLLPYGKTTRRHHPEQLDLT
jgi:hypothetical protein